MIHRFLKVTDGLYRGSAPTPKDVLWLKENYGINKIVSLDMHCGIKINRPCKMLKINHVMVPIEHTHLKLSLLHLFNHNLKELLLEGGPTFVHCYAGKDRTGFLIALLKSKYFGEDPEEMIKEAESLGFGVDANPYMIQMFKKIIRACKKSHDINNADIVSNTREPISDTRSGYLDEAKQQSFAPYLSQTRQYPYDNVYNPINDQSPTRDNPGIIMHDNGTVPQVGQFNNEIGMQAAGPSLNAGGFIND